MAIKYVVTFSAALLVLTGTFSTRAQEQRRGWDPPLETRAVLSVRESTGGGGSASVSIELNEREYSGLVITPGFRSGGELCVSSVQSGFDASALERAAVGWHVEARLVELRAGEATIDLRWNRRVNRADIAPAESVTSEKRIVMREGDTRILDLVRTTSRPAPECDAFGLTYEVEFAGPRELAGAAIGYDLWLVQQDADGELVTDRYQVSAKQGQQVDYFFRPVPYSGEGRRRARDAAAILMNVSGEISGRVRTDGNIDLTVDGTRGFSDAAASAAVSTSGRTMLTVKPGETVEVAMDLPVGGTLSTLGNLKQVFGNHKTAVRVTARRLW